MFDRLTGAYTRSVSAVDSRKNLLVDPAIRAPHTDEYSLGVDREVGRRLSVAAGDVGVAAVAEDLGTPRSLVLSHFARFTSRGSTTAGDGAGEGASSSRARPSSTARL